MMVDEDAVGVEARLAAGGYGCGACGVGCLRPWGFARRRGLRDRGGGLVVVRPRRGRCGSCRVTTVMMPTVAFFRRRDVAAVIGEALDARFVKGRSRAEVIEDTRWVPADTVRGWWRRFVARAEEIRVLFTGWAHRLDASLGPIAAQGSPAADALEAIGLAAGAAGRRLGPGSVWSLAAGISGGLLLFNTSRPLPSVD